MRLQDRAAVIVMAAIAMVLLAACTADNRTATPSTKPASSPAVATPTAGACTAAQVRDLVNQFVHAFNIGDQRALQQLWAQQGDGFDWYSTDAPGQRILAAAKDRAGLVHYFAARHAAGESLRLTSFQFNGNSAAYGNFQYTLIRRANDLTATTYTGKGAAICAPTRSTLGVWSMAKDPRSRATTPPPSGTPQATNTFHAMGAQIAEVSYLEKFITAYNAGDLLAALAQFSPTQPVAFSDCDYATQQLVDGHGRAQLTHWLRTNIAHHDRLTIGSISSANPDQPVLGASFSRRSSDTIARAGRPDGITPTLAAKVKFDPNGLITEFNNGPFGGPTDSCRID